MSATNATDFRYSIVLYNDKFNVILGLFTEDNLKFINFIPFSMDKFRLKFILFLFFE